MKKKSRKRNFSFIVILIVIAAGVLLLSSSNIIKVNVLSQNNISKDVSNYKYEYELIENQQDQLEKTKRELIFFTASWCGSCSKVRSILLENSQNLSNLTIYEIDLEENRYLANVYSVNFAPTIIFNDGGDVKRVDEFDLSKINSLIAYAASLN